MNNEPEAAVEELKPAIPETPPTLLEYEAAIRSFVAGLRLADDEMPKEEICQRLIASAKELLDETMMEMGRAVTSGLALVLLRIYEKGSSPAPFLNNEMQRLSKILVQSADNRKALQQVMQVLGPDVPAYQDMSSYDGLAVEVNIALGYLRDAGIKYQYRKAKVDGKD